MRQIINITREFQTKISDNLMAQLTSAALTISNNSNTIDFEESEKYELAKNNFENIFKIHQQNKEKIRKSCIDKLKSLTEDHFNKIKTSVLKGLDIDYATIKINGNYGKILFDFNKSNVITYIVSLSFIVAGYEFDNSSEGLLYRLTSNFDVIAPNFESLEKPENWKFNIKSSSLDGYTFLPSSKIIQKL